jgi:hypothetical protein
MTDFESPDTMLSDKPLAALAIDIGKASQGLFAGSEHLIDHNASPIGRIAFASYYT